MHHVLDVVSISDEVNAQQAGVAVGGVKGLEAVTDIILHCQASQAAAQMLHMRGRNRCLYSIVLKVGLYNTTVMEKVKNTWSVWLNCLQCGLYVFDFKKNIRFCVPSSLSVKYSSLYSNLG